MVTDGARLECTGLQARDVCARAHMRAILFRFSDYLSLGPKNLGLRGGGERLRAVDSPELSQIYKGRDYRLTKMATVVRL